MLSEKENLQRQYQGYKTTPNLWRDTSVLGLAQFIIPQNTKDSFVRCLPTNLRLGKRVEQFVFNELERQDGISILTENIQIQNGKQTIGELDTIITYLEVPIHVEIVYKFYVYDETVGVTELDHFIGPNRTDSLVEKLKKLKNKQLPLLYKSQTQALLQSIQVAVEAIEQQVIFKAQLFLPFNTHVTLKVVNPDCVVGYYISIHETSKFENCQFHFPTKPNWLQEPHKAVNWLNYDSAQNEFFRIKTEKQSVCCWIKNNNKLDRCFIVWW